jgi:hypothetical protein
MKRSVLVLSIIMAVGSASVARMGAAQEGASKPPEQSKTSPSPAPANAVSTEEAKRAAARAPTSSQTAKRPPRTLKMFLGEFRGLDLDKKTLSFQTDEGKSYTVEAQVPGMVEAKQRAAELSQILQPGDRIRMLCRVNEKEEPILILSLHMTGDKAPMRFR